MPYYAYVLRLDGGKHNVWVQSREWPFDRYLKTLYENHGIKVGMTSDLNKRINALNRTSTYQYSVMSYFELSSEVDALLIESILRKYYYDKYPDAWNGKDHFYGIKPTTEYLHDPLLRKILKKLQG